MVKLTMHWEFTTTSLSTGTSAALIIFAKRRDIDVLAIEASHLGYRLPGAHERYEQFVEDAHERGLGVAGVIGYSWFTVPPHAGVPGQPASSLEGLDLVQNISQARVFDFLVDDSQKASKGKKAKQSKKPSKKSKKAKKPTSAAQNGGYLNRLAPAE
ncbi:MAG: hypothetical protein GY711_01925 [bacterium]|nr:hypothetical protein [bacterium]